MKNIGVLGLVCLLAACNDDKGNEEPPETDADPPPPLIDAGPPDADPGSLWEAPTPYAVQVMTLPNPISYTDILGQTRDVPIAAWLLYLDHVGARHTLFQGNLDACLTETTQEVCDDLWLWLSTTVLAFLEAAVRGDGDAETWLSSAELEAFSAGVATITTK